MRILLCISFRNENEVQTVGSFSLCMLLANVRLSIHLRKL